MVGFRYRDGGGERLRWPGVSGSPFCRCSAQAGDALVVAQLLFRGVQRGGQLVVRFDLPVRRAGRAVAAAVGVDRVRQGERGEGEARVVDGLRVRRSEGQGGKAQGQKSGCGAQREPHMHKN